MRAPTHVSVVLLSLLVLLTLPAAPLGCGEDGWYNAKRGAARSPSSPPVPVGPAAPDEPPPLPVAPAIDVAGRVVGGGDEPVVGRTVAILDRRGRRTEALTDEDGGFHFAAVAAPYDVLVAPAPSGAIITPLAFLGLKRGDPRLEVFEPRGPMLRPASESIKIGVHLPACRASVGACWVSVVSTSPSGGGATAISYIEGTALAVLEVEHAWRAETTRAGETIDVHVLVGSADYTEYSYAHASQLPVRPGEAIDAGVLAPLHVEATDRVTLSAQSPKVPDGWQWTLSTSLDLADGATFSLLYEWSPSAALRLPKLPSATFRVGAWIQQPPVETPAYSHRSSQAWSGTLPLETPNVALDLPLGPEMVRPSAEGQMSRRGLGYAWDAKARGLYTLVVADLVRGRQVMRVFTSEPDLALSELESLGLPKLEPGEHVLDLTTRPDADVDELTQPVERIRTRRFAITAPGMESYQRFRFVVTP